MNRHLNAAQLAVPRFRQGAFDVLRPMKIVQSLMNERGHSGAIVFVCRRSRGQQHETRKSYRCSPYPRYCSEQVLRQSR